MVDESCQQHRFPSTSHQACDAYSGAAFNMVGTVPSDGAELDVILGVDLIGIPADSDPHRLNVECGTT